MSPLLKDTVVCESLGHGPVREGPLLVLSDMCVVIDGSVNDEGLEHVSPLFSLVLHVESLVKMVF